MNTHHVSGLCVYLYRNKKKREPREKCHDITYDDRKNQASVAINTQHVSLRQIVEEKGRGKPRSLETVWVDENG
jgi:uncharacterized protein YlbG (UPF0298 family)